MPRSPADRRQISDALREMLAGHFPGSLLTFQVPIEDLNEGADRPSSIDSEGPSRTEGMSPPAPRQPTHADDFAAINWYGEIFTFTARQRAVVAGLWQAREEGTHFLSGTTLLKLAESNSRRVRDIFRDHPAWARLIVLGNTCGGGLGTYRLADGPLSASAGKAGVA
ncbi:MAG: hypothetical protein K8T89_09245 [Planctomycetes bacterium]|nr:hypothetical protein [Planctomycetota bacterium]